MQADPRNHPILIHKDGWAPHSTSSKHSIAAITIAKACTSKLDRSRNKNAQAYSFIPVNQLPKDSPHKLDAFFDPLLTEFEDLYMYGLEVFYKSAIPNFSAANDIATLTFHYWSLPISVLIQNRINFSRWSQRMLTM